jgi:hypothetical protein
VAAEAVVVVPTSVVAEAAVTLAAAVVTSAAVAAELVSAEALISATGLVLRAQTSERAIAEVESVSACLTLQVGSSELRLRPCMSIRLSRRD